ncbi:hypothetical protein [Saccharothrix luteola]|uniref:hypothetical protein n=1 Tax=Saccharothrix luteola TaxID=2893018 RepID=UPI001E3B4616|nr:hypothetical protein [Saccharothrix luteola]MCC8247804.1 hypothetical protein [Saccharothrix luteola]
MNELDEPSPDMVAQPLWTRDQFTNLLHLIANEQARGRSRSWRSTANGKTAGSRATAWRTQLAGAPEGTGEVG